MECSDLEASMVASDLVQGIDFHNCLVAFVTHLASLL